MEILNVVEREARAVALRSLGQLSRVPLLWPQGSRESVKGG